MWSSRSTSLILSYSPCQLDPFSKPLISAYSLDRLHHWVVIETKLIPRWNFPIETKLIHAPNLVSFSFNFQWACITSLLPVMYNARGLRCNTKQERLHTLHLRRCQSHLQPSWPRLFPVSGMTIVHHPPTSACSCLSILRGPVHCPTSSLKLILRTSESSVTKLLFVSFFLLHCRHLRISFSLSPLSTGSLKAGAVTYLCLALPQHLA